APTRGQTMNDVPKEFANKGSAPDYVTRVEMIQMRDGVKLRTFIVVPKEARNAPIILSRTPYQAGAFNDYLVQAGYIRARQDVRGKYGSEGDYVVTRPARGPLNHTGVDHTTDAWDTIDWLVKHTPESNGRVGMIGASYDGFTAVMALLEPHPALKAVVPQGPLIDAWMGDDWFHYGAFRNLMLGYIQMQSGQRGAGSVTPSASYDKYDELLRVGSTGDYVRVHGLEQLPWVVRTINHPAYDSYWEGQALDKLLVARHPPAVPTLWTQGLWDQEDMWGANHTWLALKAAGRQAHNWLVLGPWNHIQVHGDGAALGPLRWNGNTALQYRRDMLLPFFSEHLRGGPSATLAPVTVFNTGEDKWERFETWPNVCESGCRSRSTPLYLHAGFRLSFDLPADAAGGDAYVSDPAKPVPFLPRPIVDPFGTMTTTGLGDAYDPWAKWLVADQRFVDGRPDVLVYESAVLTEPVRVQGIPVADIRAMTTGTDGDFVVKLIDVYPPLVPGEPRLGGYELPIALDIFRGRYRDSFREPTAIPPNRAQRYRFDMPNVNHVFQPGHRIMVQIQSSLFPLYDRNPQTFVPNIFFAKPADYQKAEVTILRSKDQPSMVWLPVVK
ncbi:MAG: CocE/NonD family hydrolase, partial [Gemmatimonadaceae bacterium]|nr:CocE/NonD family hydrolase [Gemmatimonadaceae bacterium]